MAENNNTTTLKNGYPPEFWIWCGIKKRCFNPKDKRYHRYGGRGITLASQWISDFESFYGYVGPRPTPSHSIDRIDNDGNYEPGNVRWSTPTEQRRNSSTVKPLVLGARVQLMQDWAREYGINPRTLKGRLADGWELQRALTTPVRKIDRETPADLKRKAKQDRDYAAKKSKVPIDELRRMWRESSARRRNHRDTIAEEAF